MIRFLLLLLLIFNTNVSSSRLKPLKSKERPIRSLITQFIRGFSRKSASISPNFEIMNRPPIPALVVWKAIPDSSLEAIFEFIYTDHASLRLVCKAFQKSFDNVIYRMSWIDLPVKDSSSAFKIWFTAPYKLINLVIGERIFFQELEKQKLTIHHEPNLTIQESFLVLLSVKDCHPSKKLLLISSLLKLEIVQWSMIRDFFILQSQNLPLSPDLKDILTCSWTLGLMTVAKHLANERMDVFAEAVEVEKGISIAIQNNHHDLARFMIIQINSYYRISKQRGTTRFILESVIKGEYWDIMLEIFNESPRSHYNLRLILMVIASEGKVPSSSYLGKGAPYYAKKLVFMAASKGHLDFLKELHLVGILLAPFCLRINDLGETAAHVAAHYGNVECLRFILNEANSFCMNLFSVKDYTGFNPIHSAVHSGSESVLKEILWQKNRFDSV